MERAQQDANLAFLNEVKLYIMENMDKEDLTVDDIASRMCMSRKMCIRDRYLSSVLMR